MASSSKIPTDEDIDYTDIESKYHVAYEDGFDNVIVVDNVPIIDEKKKEKLLSVIAKKFTQKGVPVGVEGIHMPWDEGVDKCKG